MPKHYQLLTVNDLRKDEEEILGILSDIGGGKLQNDLRLLNYYRELPVSFDASVDYIEGGVADVQVHDLQAAAMIMEKQTFIKSEHLPHDVVAKVLKVRKDRHQAVLGYFQYAQVAAERRMYARVRVAEKHDAAFQHERHFIRGQLEDISFGGVSIAAPRGSIVEENVTGMVRLSLPNATLEVSGTLLKVDEDEKAVKYVFEFEADARSERVISSFIFSQQSIIIRDLKDLFSSGPDTLIP